MKNLIRAINISRKDKIKRKLLQNKNFTIICSNCIGGVIYHDLGMRFDSPTINLYILANDYIKFLSNLTYYLNSRLIEVKNSNKNFPVGKLSDITIYFMHYSSFKEAKEKWERRKKKNKCQ